MQHLFRGVLPPVLRHDQVLRGLRSAGRLLQHVRVVRHHGIREPRVLLLLGARDREQNAQGNRRPVQTRIGVARRGTFAV